MKLLTVIPEMGSGGAEAVVETLTRHLAQRGHQTWVASSGGWRAERLGDDGARVVTARMRGRRPADLLDGLRAVRRAVAEIHPDVLHAHNVKAAAVAHLAARVRVRRHRVPLVVTAHGFPPASYRGAARLLRAVRPDLVVAVSEDVAERLRAEGFHGPTRIVENTIEPLPAHPRDEARARLGLDAHTPVVVCLARMTAQKRQDLLLRTWHTQPRDAVLLLAGDGSTRPALDELARLSPAADRIRFLGNRSDPDWLLAAADLLVLPSDWEGLPITLLEAMGAGVPVVASAVGGVGSLRGGVALTPAGDADALATEVRRLLGDPTARTLQAQRGRDLLHDRFDPAAMSAAYEEILTGLGG